MPNPYLPPEILDSIVDFLHNYPTALKKCCLVSKSWIPRTRKHLFAYIILETERNLTLWKRTFPDPSISPAHYTKRLVIGSPNIVTTTGAEEGDWIRGFSSVVRLEIDGQKADRSKVSLLPFHGLSPIIKSLRVHFVVIPSSRAFDLILSFPLLEDLDVDVRAGSIDNDDESNAPPTIVHPSGPMLTGSLQLRLRGGMEPIARRLLSLPGGIHFRELTLTWYHERDSSSTMALVDKCSRTIEVLCITCFLRMSIRYRCPHNDRLCFPGAPVAAIDLSKATRLKGAVFRAMLMDLGWITTALRTITPKHQKLRKSRFTCTSAPPSPVSSVPTLDKPSENKNSDSG